MDLFLFGNQLIKSKLYTLAVCNQKEPEEIYSGKKKEGKKEIKGNYSFLFGNVKPVY